MYQENTWSSLLFRPRFVGLGPGRFFGLFFVLLRALGLAVRFVIRIWNVVAV